MGYLWGKMAHRAMTIGEDAAASFVPTDFGAKIEITNFVVGMWPPIDDCTLHATTNQINAGAMGGGYLRDGLVDGCVEGFYFII